MPRWFRFLTISSGITQNSILPIFKDKTTAIELTKTNQPRLQHKRAINARLPQSAQINTITTTIAAVGEALCLACFKASYLAYLQALHLFR